MINRYSLEYEVRLVGSDVPTRGRAQLFYDGHWLEFCQDLSSFFLQNGPTVCNQLGYGYARTFSSEEGIEMFGEPDTNETISALCFGIRSNIEDCSLSFFPCTSYGLYLACTPPGKESLLIFILARLYLRCNIHLNVIVSDLFIHTLEPR